jgi:NTE family protein
MWGNHIQLMSGNRPTTQRTKVKAYAVLAGGGIKGAALVGGLSAAADFGIEFVGYGGVSAGSIIALLASLGYSPEELYRTIVETDFNTFFDDGSGKTLDRVKAIKLRRYLIKSWRLFGDYRLLRGLRTDLGFYSGHNIERFILNKITNALPQIQTPESITFRDLKQNGCRPLKVFVSDVTDRKHLTCSAAEPPNESEEVNVPVIPAIRASISYPFVFKPYRLGSRYLVDGGLISNMPAFLFRNEQARTGFPIIAFDLKQTHRRKEGGYGLLRFGTDMVLTAMEGSEGLHLETMFSYMSDFIYVPIQVPEKIDTFKFGLTTQERSDLFHVGERETFNVLKRRFSNMPVFHARTPKEAIQAVHNMPPRTILPLFRAMVNELEKISPAARDLRAYIMLANEEDNLVLGYSFNMDGDSDEYFELSTNSKWVARAYHESMPVVGDLNELRKEPRRWGMTREQADVIKRTQQTFISVPIFKAVVSRKDENRFQSRGLLTVDSSSSIQETQWTGDNWEAVIREMIRWSDVFSRLFR